MLLFLKRQWFKIRCLFLLPSPTIEPRYIIALANACPMPTDPNAAANKRHFVWRFAYWAKYNQPDLDTLSAYWELIKDNNDNQLWLASPRCKVSTLLRFMLK